MESECTPSIVNSKENAFLYFAFSAFGSMQAEGRRALLAQAKDAFFASQAWVMKTNTPLLSTEGAQEQTKNAQQFDTTPDDA